ncbi:MAG: hypothetical protein ACR2PJ_05865, partial [Pseudomonadales bacterium]
MSKNLDTASVIQTATYHLREMKGRVYDLLTVSEPASPDAAVDLSKIVSKLSPIVGNMLEISIVEYLNAQSEYAGHGQWKRQDPGFPDVIFSGVDPVPGFEIKAWFPLATE